MIKQKTHISAIALAAFLFTGCASIPDSTLKYYLPKADVQLGAVMTMACVKDAEHFQLKYIVSPRISSEISADYDADQTIDLHDFNNTFGSNNIEVSWYEDGRLKGINSTSTGGGSQVLEAALELIEPIVTPQNFSNKDTENTADEICNEMTANKVPVISFQYQHPQRLTSDTIAKNFILIKTSASEENKEDTSTSEENKKSCKNDGCEIDLALSKESAALRKKYGLGSKRVPDSFNAFFFAQSYNLSDRVASPSNGAGIPIVLRDSLSLYLSIIPEEPVKSGILQQYKTSQVIPGKGSTSTVYIPNTPLFGTNQLSLTLAPNGNISSIKYGVTSGAAQALGSLNSLVTALSGPTDAELAAQYKVQGDVIENHRRLLCLEGVTEAC